MENSTSFNVGFTVVVTCKNCQSVNIDEVINCYEDGNTEIIYTCNNCGNCSR